MDSSALLMYHDPRDLESFMLIQIQKEHSLSRDNEFYCFFFNLIFVIMYLHVHLSFLKTFLSFFLSRIFFDYFQQISENQAVRGFNNINGI